MLVLIQQIAADRLSAFAWLDVLVSGERGVFVAIESRRLKMRHGPWAAMSAAVITTGSALWHSWNNCRWALSCPSLRWQVSAPSKTCSAHWRPRIFGRRQLHQRRFVSTLLCQLVSEVQTIGAAPGLYHLHRTSPTAPCRPACRWNRRCHAGTAKVELDKSYFGEQRKETQQPPPPET